MREDICSIPINDVFKPKDGCPLCNMRDMLEQRMTEYITGAAMMEPDVRICTNEQGFCHNHFSMMLEVGSRLSNALILQSHLKKISTDLIPNEVKGKPDKKQLAKLQYVINDCFVCNQINDSMEKMFNSIFAMWQKSDEFRKLYSEQKYICMEHYSMLMNSAVKNMSSKVLPDFYSETAKLCGEYLKVLYGDITHFCSMFDYRNGNADWGKSKDSIERSIKFLTSREVETEE